jgi:hypothetical protein
LNKMTERELEMFLFPKLFFNPGLHFVIELRMS